MTTGVGMGVETEIATVGLSPVMAHPWLVVAAVSLPTLPICLTVIILVWMVEPGQRVEAIKALAPTLSRIPLFRRSARQARYEHQFADDATASPSPASQSRAQQAVVCTQQACGAAEGITCGEVNVERPGATPGP
jgi:hypothetical protein